MAAKIVDGCECLRHAAVTASTPVEKICCSQSIVEEFHATREPWRWMHLVCGAQAAAISFGKNMTVYEEYLELLHAA
jgi:hypothetical protein